MPIAAPVPSSLLASPFSLEHPDLYARWRERRLEEAPTRIEDLIVEIADPRRLTQTEHAAILDRCRRANMAIYAGRTGNDPDKDLVRALGTDFGLHRMDRNMGADEDAITSIKVQTDIRHREYIPYSTKAIAWHTDGYYNSPAHQIHGMVLHCVQPAEHGGANGMLDHEIAYILVRDQNPAYIRALMQPQAMTIPANVMDGQVMRPEQAGPVFAVTPSGRLHMRYTDRKRNILWQGGPLATAAVACLQQVLRSRTPWHLEGRLESGWGLVCNNVLHTRTGFDDGPKPRLLYRARYYDRIEGT